MYKLIILFFIIGCSANSTCDNNIKALYPDKDIFRTAYPGEDVNLLTGEFVIYRIDNRYYYCSKGKSFTAINSLKIDNKIRETN